MSADQVDGSSLEVERVPVPTDTAAEGALILARIRATGWAEADKPGFVLAAASAAAALVDRRLVEVSDRTAGQRVLVLGWADGAGPTPDLHPSAPASRLSPVPNLAWAVCLAAAWPRAESDPYPGIPFRRTDMLRACNDLGADKKAVKAAIDGTLVRAGLISLNGEVGRLGPAAAALPTPFWSALRRLHDRLPHSVLDHIAATSPTVGSEESDAVPTARGLPQPASGPAGHTETFVRAAVTALETAQGPVADSDLPALADPAIRRATELALARCGRALVRTKHGFWTTGYTEDVEESLASERTGTLSSEERAVLALVLLRAVAIPRAQGHHRHDGWATIDHPVRVDELKANRCLSMKTIEQALRGLRVAGYITHAPSGGYVPGPALARVSPARRAALWEDLVLVSRPGGVLAEGIRARRDETTLSATDRPGPDTAPGATT